MSGIDSRPGSAETPDLERALECMLTIRAFERRLLELFRAGRLTGTTHTCIGQEANAVGVASVLECGDVIVSNHRGHGHFIAHVGDIDGLMAEIMGRATGVCGGWGGSQHLCRPDQFYSNGIQGGIAPLAVGLAMADRLRASNGVVVVFLGDGTFGAGAVYEALNLAALLSAPVLFAVEDNGIAQTTPTSATTSGSLPARAAAFGIPCVSLEYPTVDEVCAAAAQLLPAVRADGPAMLCLTSARLEAHSKGDDTRSDALLAQLRERDPLARTASAFPADRVTELEARAQTRVDAAVGSAEQAPVPAIQSPAGASAGQPQEAPPMAGARDDHSDATLAALAGRTLRQQLNESLHSLMQRHGDVVLIGEDIVDPYGGAFRVTAGLSTAYPDRVIAAPISEGAIVGLAGGMAMRGFRPVVELMFGDFVTLAMDQLVNHLAKFRGMYNGQVRVPAVIRVPMGGQRGYGPTHSQTLEKQIVGVPGLAVLAPSFLHPAGRMLERALEADGPTVFVENKVAYNDRVESPRQGMADEFFLRYCGEEAAPTLCLSLTEFEDDGATIVTYGGMLSAAMASAKSLFIEHELACRIVAPGRLHPLDVAGLLRCLAPTGPLVSVEEASAAFGIGSEIGALVAEHGVLQPGRRFVRLGAANHVVAASRSLEQEILPGPTQIVTAIESLLDGIEG